MWSTAGMQSTAVISTIPMIYAPHRALLLNRALVNTTGLSDLQLNPWNSLLMQSVPNAIVLPRSALPPSSPAVNHPLCPIRNAITVMIQMLSPPIPICDRNDLVRMDSLAGRGLSFISSLLCGSSPSAMAGKLSVSRLMNSRCTGANGTGSANTEAYNTARIAPKLPESRKSMEFLIFL